VVATTVLANTVDKVMSDMSVVDVITDIDTLANPTGVE
jgi:hypothetical protein